MLDSLPALAASADFTGTEPAYLWISLTREELAAQQNEVQAALQSMTGVQLLDLHISDLLNTYIPSQYDYTSQYDVIFFRCLAVGVGEKSADEILRRVDTSPLGLVVFDQLLLSVHSESCAVRDALLNKLSVASIAQRRTALMPQNSADLMLRLVGCAVDGFLELRRELSRQLDFWQSDLFNPQSQFDNWRALLDARLTLHYLDEICEDHYAAMQDWGESLKTWPAPETKKQHHERELLQVRSRDVLEHIDRVVHHVHRLEQSTETAVQMHFNAQSNRTNNIMRTLTALTAIFLPLNLIAGFFGMNFDGLPLIHHDMGFWWVSGSMLLIAISLSILLWRQRYLTRA